MSEEKSLAIAQQENRPAMLSYEHIEKMARVITASGLFGIQKPEQALALMLVAQAEGMHPVTAARDYHIIQGRPTLKADAMLTRFVQAGGSIEWILYTDERVSAVFRHPKSGEVTIEWDINRAKRANLTNKDIWKAYPRNMLRARVITEGVRTVAPWVAVGVLSSEEAEDMGTQTVQPLQEPAAQEQPRLRRGRMAKAVEPELQPVDAEIEEPETATTAAITTAEPQIKPVADVNLFD